MFDQIFKKNSKNKQTEYFLAIEIHEALIKTAIWEIVAGQPSVVSLGSYEMWDSQDSLINGVDASLTEAIKTLQTQPDRVILGLPDSWLVADKIHPSKQSLIKSLINALSLKPIGLVTISSAITSQLRQVEGIPPSAIIVEIYVSKIIISLVVLGHNQTTEEVARSDDLAKDIEEGLSRMEAEKYPARFILTNGSELENEEQQIVAYPWSEKLPFVHLPKVQVLPVDFSIRAIALAGGSEAARSLGIDVETENTVQAPIEVTVETSHADLEEVGFQIEKSDNLEIPEVVEEVEETQSVHETHIEEPVIVSAKKPIKTFGPKFKLPNFDQYKKPLYFILPLALLFITLVGASAFHFFFSTVEIEVSLEPKKVSDNILISFGEGGQVEAVKQTLSSSTTDTAPTTGEATVGDKATGKVTLYNFSSSSLSLKAGTKLAGPGTNQVFVLDSSAEIASRSAQTEPPFTITPGSASVAVTAARIGAELNLERSTQFSVDTYPKSTVIASADVAFSGGTSRAVKAVAKSDQDKLLAQATKKIQEQLAKQQQELDSSKNILVISDVKYLTKKFDKNVDEEASSLNLELEAGMDVLLFKNEDLLKVITPQLANRIDSGSEIIPSRVQYSFSPATTKDGKTTSQVSVTAYVTPNVDTQAIAGQFKGRNVVELKDFLDRLQGFKEAFVKPSLSLPILERYLPFVSNNIKIMVKYL